MKNANSMQFALIEKIFKTELESVFKIKFIENRKIHHIALFMISLTALIGSNGSANESKLAIETLLESCNSISETDKRLACFKAIQRISSEAKQELTTKQELEYILIDIKNQLSVGISYTNYSTTLLTLSKNIGHLKDKLQYTNQKSAALLDEALADYSNALSVWNASLMTKKIATPLGPAFDSGITNIAGIIKKYHLPTQESLLPLDVALSTI